MEPNKKKRYELEIAGIKLSLLSDEPQDNVSSIAKQLDSRITEMTRSSNHVSKLDAAVLCAIDYLSILMKSAKYCRDCEAKITVCENTISRLNSEIDELKAELKSRDNITAEVESTGFESVDKDMKKIGDILRGDSENATAEDKVRTLEKYLDTKNSSSSADQPQTRAEKIKYIESLLRGN